MRTFSVKSFFARFWEGTPHFTFEGGNENA
jgi:hypothetical protein